jgi:hypothetical protein
VLAGFAGSRWTYVEHTPEQGHGAEWATHFLEPRRCYSRDPYREAKRGRGLSTTRPQGVSREQPLNQGLTLTWPAIAVFVLSWVCPAGRGRRIPDYRHGGVIVSHEGIINSESKRLRSSLGSCRIPSGVGETEARFPSTAISPTTIARKRGLTC